MTYILVGVFDWTVVLRQEIALAESLEEDCASA
jgi:hypothetical protein